MRTVKCGSALLVCLQVYKVCDYTQYVTWCTEDVLIVLLWIYLKGRRIFLWILSDCEINWVLFSILFYLKSRFRPYSTITSTFLHLLLHHLLQSEIWIQKDSADVWSFPYIFCWSIRPLLVYFSSLWRHLKYHIEVLVTCIQTHTGRDNKDKGNGKPSLSEFSSQLEGRENVGVIPVTREQMWGRCNIYLRTDQCGHKTTQ